MNRYLSWSATLSFAVLTATALSDSSAAGVPSAATLLTAAQDNANWLLPAKSYAGNRYTSLTNLPALQQVTLGGTTCPPNN